MPYSRPTVTLSDRFSDALVYAAALHGNQRRKVSGEPYIAHLLAVAATVLEYGGDEDEAIAGLLHDAVEDQGGPATAAAIAARFGTRVAEIVDGCSDAVEMPKPPWQQRKERFLGALATASSSVRLVTAADKLHNVRALTRDYRRIGDELWTHFRGGRDGTLWYHRAIADALVKLDEGPLVAELRDAVAALERLVARRAAQE
ncbi:MAG: HD domain-containing protein [Planctomycetota bacterium]